MSNINKSIFSGNLAADPGLRYTPNGTAVASFRVAVNRSWRDDKGDLQKKTAWVDVKAFGRKAETISQYFGKGRPILVEGHLDMDTWTDKQTGKPRSKLLVTLDDFDFIGGEAPGRQAPPADNSSGPIDDDDIPT